MCQGQSKNTLMKHVRVMRNAQCTISQYCMWNTLIQDTIQCLEGVAAKNSRKYNVLQC